MCPNSVCPKLGNCIVDKMYQPKWVFFTHESLYTLQSMKYSHGFDVCVSLCGCITSFTRIHMLHLPVFFRVAFLPLKQPHECQWRNHDEYWCQVAPSHFLNPYWLGILDIHTETERSSGWLPWSSLGALKLAFNVSSDDKGSHPDVLSISVHQSTISLKFDIYW